MLMHSCFAVNLNFFSRNTALQHYLGQFRSLLFCFTCCRKMMLDICNTVRFIRYTVSLYAIMRPPPSQQILSLAKFHTPKFTFCEKYFPEFAQLPGMMYPVPETFSEYMTPLSSDNILLLPPLATIDLFLFLWVCFSGILYKYSILQLIAFWVLVSFTWKNTFRFSFAFE